MRTIWALLFVLLPVSAFAQIGTEPMAWSEANRQTAYTISNWTLGAQVGASSFVAVKDWREGNHKTAYRTACSIGVAIGVATPLKYLVHEPRPNGLDNQSWPSGHAASSAALSGWNFTFGIPLAAMTGILRVNANYHHTKDVVSGWAIGAGAQALCSALIR